jgi:hypothetical protein
MKHILLIELKKGQSTIGREEMGQAQNYVQDIQQCGLIEGSPAIDAYVVGHNVSNKVSTPIEIAKTLKVHAVTFGQLVRTGDKRLFRLRNVLSERYDQKGTGSKVLDEVLSEPIQENAFEKEEIPA